MACLWVLQILHMCPQCHRKAQDVIIVILFGKSCSLATTLCAATVVSMVLIMIGVPLTKTLTPVKNLHLQHSLHLQTLNFLAGMYRTFFNELLLEAPSLGCSRWQLPIVKPLKHFLAPEKLLNIRSWHKVLPWPSERYGLQVLRFLLHRCMVLKLDVIQGCGTGNSQSWSFQPASTGGSSGHAFCVGSVGILVCGVNVSFHQPLIAPRG